MVIESLCWWYPVLSTPGGSCSLSPCHKVDPDIWVDASSSWGISLVVGNQWAAWRLWEGWKHGNRDIAWAELVTLELGILWFFQSDFSDLEVMVKGGNTRVISAFNKG